MRKNKKLLLASVAAMGALALGVGATSTFAWYQATATAHLATPISPVNASITASTDKESLGDQEFVLNVTATVFAHSGEAGDRAITDAMEMTTFANPAPATLVGDDDSDHLYFGYYTQGSNTVRYSAGQFGTSDYWRIIKVHVELDSATLTALGYTEAEAVALLNAASTNNGYTLKVDSKKNGAGSDTRAVLHSATSSSGAPTEAYTLKTLNLTAAATDVVVGGADYYFGMYVEGEADDRTSGAPDASITITATRADVA